MEKLTKEELHNIDVIFSLARQAVVNNEEQLLTVIQFKKQLLDKINPVDTSEEKEQTTDDTSVAN